MERKLSEIMDVCLLAGELMLKSGAETYRVEDTMTRMARAFNIQSVNVFVSPTAIILSVQERDFKSEQTKLTRITERSVDLHKVVLVNDISRKVSQGLLTLKETQNALDQIVRSAPAYPLWVQILAAAVSSGCFTIMFQGTWHDFLPAVVTGAIGFIVFKVLHHLVKVKFFSEVMAALAIGLAARLFIGLGVASELDKIIIGSVMPLVPGLLITNAIRDLMAGDLMSGLSRGAEAFFTAFAIGTGIAVVLSIF